MIKNHFTVESKVTNMVVSELVISSSIVVDEYNH
jgi:hypothetical protein